jgi:phenylacetate-CoA ligase
MTFSKAEAVPRDELEELQNERLRETIRHSFKNSPYYRQVFKDIGIDPRNVKTVEDISELPFTTKNDFAEHYPDGFLAVDRTELDRIQASSGTSGEPKIVGYTSQDVQVWREVQARSLYAAGVRSDHSFQQTLPYGLFTGGFGKHFGLKELGATEIPVGPVGSRQQLKFLDEWSSESCVLIPSYALYLAEEAEKEGYDPKDTSLENIIIGAEPTTEKMRDEVEAAWDADATNNYGLTEIMGPGVAAECQTGKNGLHVWEDHFYPEIIDPESGERLPPRSEGELVLTSLTKQGVPMIRYRTGDITALYKEKCECGRTHRRIAYITGRADNLLTVRGANVYPSEIEEILLDIDELAPHYRIDLWSEQNLDRIKVTAETTHDLDGDSANVEDVFRNRFESHLSFEVDEVAVVEPGSLERSGANKVQRVYDER